MAHMAFWTVEDRGYELTVSFRQGESVQDMGAVPHLEADGLIGWLFHAPDGAQQYDHVRAPFCHGWVLEPNGNKN
jgi:hypothetical protein